MGLGGRMGTWEEAGLLVWVERTASKNFPVCGPRDHRADELPSLPKMGRLSPGEHEAKPRLGSLPCFGLCLREVEGQV